MNPPVPPSPPDVFTTVGTDHHPFDRLVRWMQAWHDLHPDATGTIQHGASRAPQGRDGVEVHDLVAYECMVAAFRRADAVVCHGGPATIMDARYAGTLPIVLPRSAADGEHVDDHQVRFCTRLAELGQVVLVETFEQLDTALEKVLVDRDAYRLPDTDDDVLPAVTAFAAQVRSLGPDGVDPTPQPDRSLAQRLEATWRRRRLRA